MDHLRRTPLLSAADEQRLATEIEVGLVASDALARGRRPGRATEEELRALARIGREARERFVEANLRLVQMVVVRHAARPGVCVDDLFQEGVIGLTEAVDRFDHRRGVRFATYALTWIRARVRLLSATGGGRLPIPAARAAQLRRLRWRQNELTLELGRMPTRQELVEAFDGDSQLVDDLRLLRPPESLDELTAFDPPDPSAPPELGEEVDSTAVRAVLSRLSAPERCVIEARYGFGRPQATYLAIAAQLEISPSTARRLEERALEQLRGLVTTDMRPQAA